MSWLNPSPEMRLAHAAVKDAVTSGRMTRQPCEVCGLTPGLTIPSPVQRAIQRVVAHHDNYSEPLVVRWLCLSHHAAHHWQLRKEAARDRAA